MRRSDIRHFNGSVLVGIGLICFYIVLARNADYSDQIIKPVLYYGVSFLLMLFGNVLINKKKLQIPVNRLFWLITLIPFVYSSPNMLDLTLFTLGILIILTVKLNLQNIDTLYLVIKIVAVVNAICVFLQAIDNTFFVPFARERFSAGMYSYYMRVLSSSYISGCNGIVGDTAGYLLNAIGILCSFILICGIKKTKISSYILFGILLIALLFTGKRSHLLCGVVAVMLLYILSGKPTKKAKRILFSILAIIASYYIMRVMSAFFPNANTINRVLDSINGMILGEDISSGRNTLYGYAILQFKSAPITGIGWKVFNQLTTSLYNYSSVHYVNNDYLQILCETGIIGFVCMFIPMYIFFFKSLKALKIINKKPELFDIKIRIAIMYSVFMQIYYLIYLFLENPLYNRSFFFMYILSVLIGYKAIDSSCLKQNHSKIQLEK